MTSPAKVQRSDWLTIGVSLLPSSPSVYLECCVSISTLHALVRLLLTSGKVFAAHSTAKQKAYEESASTNQWQ
ncbi:Protein of unknown function [Gryllus bimaculatus]|nr:Protein of unknown function [Gryllus bimaculatus]